MRAHNDPDRHADAGETLISDERSTLLMKSNTAQWYALATAEHRRAQKTRSDPTNYFFECELFRRSVEDALTALWTERHTRSAVPPHGIAHLASVLGLPHRLQSFVEDIEGVGRTQRIRTERDVAVSSDAAYNILQWVEDRLRARQP